MNNMNFRRWTSFASLVVAGALSGSTISSSIVAAQDQEISCGGDAMLVFDASSSMVQETNGGSSRLVTAKRAIGRILPQIDRNRRLGLMTIGPGPGDQCSNVVLRVPMQPGAAPRIREEIDALDSDGGTPLSVAVEKAAEALSGEISSPSIIIVTDGDDTCGRDPCDEIQTLRDRHAGISVHVLGIGENSKRISCLANATRGQFLEAGNEAEMADALRTVLSCPRIAIAR